MITNISVSGFKSLENFNLDFVPGLNILVGPNGAGKTNIMSFFEFLSFLMSGSASEATSKSGGAGSVFRRVEDNYEKMIVARISGSVFSPERKNGKTKERNFITYEYSFSLVFPEASEGIMFSKQLLKLRRCREFESINLGDLKEWGAEFEISYDAEDFEILTRGSDDLLLASPYFPADGAKRRIVPQDLFRGVFGDATFAIIPALSVYYPDFRSIVRDLTGGQIYNIVPSKLKLSEDSAVSGGVARDGSGLAATLYALQRSATPQVLWGRVNRQFSEDKFDRVISYLRLVNPSISDIKIENDPFDNFLRVRFNLKSGDYSATLPLALMSDGTLKWLAIITAAVTAPSIFCIEEPENYLHPQMQGQIINILREILFDDDIARFTLMTTHSETLLNSCQPDELVIVSMLEGCTTAKRCSNASDVSDEISRTGFGLGYYFVSGALSNE